MMNRKARNVDLISEFGWVYFIPIFIAYLKAVSGVGKSLFSCKVSAPPLQATWVFIWYGPRALSPDEKRPKNKLTTHFYIVPNLRMSGVLHPFLHKPLWHAEGLWFSRNLRIFLYTTSSVAVLVSASASLIVRICGGLPGVNEAGPEADHCYPVLRIRMNGDLPPVPHIS